MTLQEGPEVSAKADAPPEGAPKLGLALFVIATAQLMLVLDSTIVSVALPSMQSSLHLAPSDLSWVMTAYLLTFGGLLLAGGRSGDLFGRRRMFRIGLLAFAVASLVGGFAPNGAALIGARAAQGIGAAIAAPTALSLLATTFPAGPARNKALGVYGAVGGLGSVVGLMLGGALTQYLDWRWVLFVNVPIAGLVLVGTSVLVEGERQQGGVDVAGAITATLGVGSLIFAISRANTVGWSSGTTIGLLVVAAVLLAIFVAIQRNSAVAMLPARVLHDRSRTGAFLMMLLVGGGMAATFYCLTLYMQVVKGYGPMACAIAYLPFAAGMVISAGGIGPQLLAKTSERTVATVGLLLGTLGTLWFGALGPRTSPWLVLLPAQLVAGIGLGMSFVVITLVSVRSVAPQDTGIASGLVNTSQQLGGALGLAALAAVALSVTNGHASSGAPAALTDGYAVALMIAAGLHLIALLVGLTTIRTSAHPHD